MSRGEGTADKKHVGGPFNAEKVASARFLVNGGHELALRIKGQLLSSGQGAVQIGFIDAKAEGVLHDSGLGRVANGLGAVQNGVTAQRSGGKQFLLRLAGEGEKLTNGHFILCQGAGLV